MKTRKLLAILLVLAIVLPVLGAGALAADEKTIYLKGSGSDFTEQWNNVFYLGGAEEASDPSVWHIVYTGKNMSAITAMQLDFGKNSIWEWEPDMGFSTNGGGKNPGWVVIAPADWEISYVNKGNNNQSNSFVVTTETKNAQFNISGFHQGTPDDEGELETTVYIYKYVNGFGPDFVGEGFVFDIFPAGGPFEDEDILAAMVSDENGYAEITIKPALEPGSYIVRERLPEGFAPVDDLVFTVDEYGVADFEDGEFIVNISLGALEVTDDVMEEYHNVYHKPLYDKDVYEDETLSSNAPEEQHLDNWFRYVIVDVSEGSEVYDSGIQFEIAKSASGKYGAEGIGYYYNVNVNESGQIELSFDDELIFTSVLARAYVDVPSKHDNGAHTDLNLGGSLIASDGSNTGVAFAIPEGADEVYLYIHFENLVYYKTDDEGERIVIGCEFDYEDGPFERLFEGEVVMTVTDDEGTEIYRGGLGKVEDLMFGDYTVAIYADGVMIAEGDVTVVAGETTNVDFGILLAPEPGTPEVICDWCSPIA